MVVPNADAPNVVAGAAPKPNVAGLACEPKPGAAVGVDVCPKREPPEVPEAAGTGEPKMPGVVAVVAGVLPNMFDREEKVTTRCPSRKERERESRLAATDSQHAETTAGPDAAGQRAVWTDANR